MSKKYNQLSLEQRYQIEALLKAGNKQNAMASILGVHPSTICRELKRNTPAAGVGSGIYWASNAQRRTTLRHQYKPKNIVFSKEMKRYCRALLKRPKYSPAIISATGKQVFDDFPCHETIYKWIWGCKRSNRKQDQQDRSLYKQLRHARRKRKRGNRNDRRGNIPGRVFIEHRPKIVEKRRRLGDLEVDLMIGEKHRSAILACLDRSTRKVVLRKLKNKESQEIKHAILEAFKQDGAWLKTMTFDNDTAFMQHQQIAAALDVKTYFTRPYTSQDKGSVENRIGVVRRFLPKSTDLSSISTKRLQQIEDMINNRPMKLFNFKSPNQVFLEKIALIT
jgi:transposase, IS30 family